MKTVAQTVIEADRFYTIAAASGNVIQAVESADNGADLKLGKYDRSPAQEWAFDRVGDDIYRIRNRANGKLIDLMMTGTANGTWLHLWEDVGGTSQMWAVEPTSEGTVRIRSSWAGGKCVDTVGIGSSEGAVLQIWQETSGSDQLWTINEVKERAKRTAEPEAVTAPAEAAEVKAEEAVAAETKPAAKKTTKRTSTKTKAAAAAEDATEEASAKKPARKCATRKKAAPKAAEADTAAEAAAAPAAKKTTRRSAAKKKTADAE